MTIKGTGRPKEYKLGRKSVVSVTTILSGTSNPGKGYEKWLIKHGENAEALREAAAETGSIAHDAIELCIHEGVEASRAFLQEKDNQQASNAFVSWQSWYDRVKDSWEFLYTEFAMVSNNLEVGGTCDAVALDDEGNVVVIDWKTSARVWPTHVIQLGAYALMLEELVPTMKVSRGLVVCCDKSTAHEAHTFPVHTKFLSKAKADFVRRVETYKFLQATKMALGIVDY